MILGQTDKNYAPDYISLPRTLGSALVDVDLIVSYRLSCRSYGSDKKPFLVRGVVLAPYDTRYNAEAATPGDEEAATPHATPGGSRHK